MAKIRHFFTLDKFFCKKTDVFILLFFVFFNLAINFSNLQFRDHPFYKTKMIY